MSTAVLLKKLQPMVWGLKVFSDLERAFVWAPAATSLLSWEDILLTRLTMQCTVGIQEKKWCFVLITDLNRPCTDWRTDAMAQSSPWYLDAQLALGPFGAGYLDRPRAQLYDHFTRPTRAHASAASSTSRSTAISRHMRLWMHSALPSMMASVHDVKRHAFG